MVCVLPLLATPTGNDGPDFALTLLTKFLANPAISSQARNEMFQEILSDMGTRNGDSYLIYFKAYQGNTLYPTPTFVDPGKDGKIRDSALFEDTVKIADSTGTMCKTTARFSLRPLEYDSAMYNVLTTIFIGCLLVIGSVVFVGDTERLVLKPIGRMMNMVEEVAKDPLQPLNLGDNGGEYETRLLETTIEKITGLLRVGFGEAGAGIISANLSAENGSSTINPLLPGVRVYAIVGFCDIHKFEFVNQQLASDILRFVNTVAEIVHSRVHYWGGQCNKNLGNAFVIIWRIGDEETIRNQIMGFTRKTDKADELSHMRDIVEAAQMATSPTRQSKKAINSGAGAQSAKPKSNLVDLKRVPGVDVMADKALIGYLKIIAEINRSPELLRYRSEPRLTHHGQQEFRVRMGFGLHAGWAIEGAVGSAQKVDATYLSPHVNMAARLETSSRQYGVPILISHFTHELFSADVQRLCRRVDVCTVKGSEVPIGVFTYDALQDQAFVHKTRKGKREKWCPEDGPQEVVKKKKKKPVRRQQSSSSSEVVGNGSPSQSSKKSLPSNSGDSVGLNAESNADESDDDDDDDDAPIFGKNNEDATDVFDNDVDLIMLRNHVTDDCKFEAILFHSYLSDLLATLL